MKLFLSLYRRKSNIFIFFMFVFLSFLFLSIAMIHQAAEDTIDELKKTYCSSFLLQVVKDETNPDYWYTIDGVRLYRGPNVGYEMLDRIMEEVEGVTEYEAGSLGSAALLWDYQLLEGYARHRLDEKRERSDIDWQYTTEETYNLQYITTVLPAGHSQNLEEFRNGSFALVEGRHIAPEDEYVVMISRALAEQNNLKVGDSFRIEMSSLGIGSGYPIYSLGGIDAEIVGFFELTYEQAVSYYTEEYDILENYIIVDQETCERMYEFEGRKDQLTRGHLYVENPEDVPEVMEEVRALDWIDWKYFTVCEDDSQYGEAVKLLKNIKLVMLAAGIATGISGMVLISLSLMHSMKKRNREWGVFMALGIPVKEIKSQVRKEYLMIAAGGFIAAVFLCFLLTPVLGNSLYKGMGGSREVREYTQEEIEEAIMRGDNALAAQMSKDQRQMQNSILPETMELHISFITVLVIGVVELLVVLFCVNDALENTLKQKPVEILSMME